MTGDHEYGHMMLLPSPTRPITHGQEDEQFWVTLALQVGATLRSSTTPDDRLDPVFRALVEASKLSSMYLG
jgi:hypothetical protein